jgi:hypothetical protein
MACCCHMSGKLLLLQGARVRVVAGSKHPVVRHDWQKPKPSVFTTLPASSLPSGMTWQYNHLFACPAPHLSLFFASRFLSQLCKTCLLCSTPARACGTQPRSWHTGRHRVCLDLVERQNATCSDEIKHMSSATALACALLLPLLLRRPPSGAAGAHPGAPAALPHLCKELGWQAWLQ